MSALTILLLESNVHYGYSNKMGILENIQCIPYSYCDDYKNTTELISNLINEFKEKYSISYTIISLHSAEKLDQFAPIFQNLERKTECKIFYETKLQSYSHYILHECHEDTQRDHYLIDVNDKIYGCFLLDGKEFPKNGPSEIGSICNDSIKSSSDWFHSLANKKGIPIEAISLEQVRQWVKEKDSVTTTMIEELFQKAALFFKNIKALSSLENFIVLGEWYWVEEFKELKAYPSIMKGLDVSWILPNAESYLMGAKYLIPSTQTAQNAYSLSTIIETNMNNLTDREKQAAQYIATHPEKVSNMTISQLSKETKVSEATITRLSQKLQFKNFNQLKLVASESSVQSFENIPKSTKSYDWLQNEYFHIIQKADDLIEKKTMVHIAKTITSSRRIMIYARGLSGHIAQKIKFKLLEYGFIADFIGDSAFMNLTSNQLTKSDSVIVVSVSGENQEIIPPVTNAKKRGANVFVFTNQKNSTLAKLANKTVLIASNRFLDKDSLFGEQVPMIYSVEVMFYEIKQLLTKQEE